MRMISSNSRNKKIKIIEIKVIKRIKKKEEKLKRRNSFMKGLGLIMKRLSFQSCN